MKDRIPKNYVSNQTMEQAYQALLDLQTYEYFSRCMVYLSPPDESYCHFHIHQRIFFNGSRVNAHIEGFLKLVQGNQLELTFTHIDRPIEPMPFGCYVLLTVSVVVSIAYFTPVIGIIAAIFGISFLAKVYKPAAEEDQEIKYYDEIEFLIYRMTHVLEATPKYPVVDS